MNEIAYPKDIEQTLAMAVSLGRAYLLDKKRYAELRELDAAVDRYIKEARR